jgi:hypothetical protein
MKGDWAVAFNSYSKSDINFLTLQTDEDLRGPDDMQANGYMIA